MGCGFGECAAAEHLKIHASIIARIILEPAQSFRKACTFTLSISQTWIGGAIFVPLSLFF
jgi:hypothetical protein